MWTMIGQEDSDGEEDHRNSISPPQKSQVWRCKVLVLPNPLQLGAATLELID